jgi:hypothetical protein
MQEEISMFVKKYTWEHKPKNKTWVYKDNVSPDGFVIKLKARLIIKGCSHILGIDYTDTFAIMSKLDIVRLLITLVA